MSVRTKPAPNQRLQRLRTEKRLSLRQVAEGQPFSHELVRLFELGRRWPSPAVAVLLARRLEVPVAELWDVTPAMDELDRLPTRVLQLAVGVVS